MSRNEKMLYPTWEEIQYPIRVNKIYLQPHSLDFYKCNEKIDHLSQ